MRAQTPLLSDAERQQLQSVVRSSKSARRDIFRSQIILYAAAGGSNEAIAAAHHTRAATVSKWRNRFLRQRLAGLLDAPRSGKPANYDVATEQRILQQLDTPPPAGYARWNGTLVSRAVGDVSRHHVWRVLRRHGISLQRRRSWCVSTDPCFAQKAADVVGLYLNPPENALVLSVDEKPHIQALERAQGWLRLPDGRALTGFAHDYKRHGTTTLFTALEVASGLVKAGHYRRRRRAEFLDFMNRLVVAYPRRTLHVILDNLNIHKPKRDRWRQHHPQVHFHYTPTHATWLNQVEIWFSLLSRQALRTASFCSTEQLRAHIDAFIAAYNQTAHPFEWSKQVVFQKHPKSSYANL